MLKDNRARWGTSSAGLTPKLRVETTTPWRWRVGALAPGALACTVTHVALVPIDVATWQCGLEEHSLHESE